MQVIDYLKKAVEDGASDIFFLAGSPATAKIEGRIVRIGEERLLPNSTKELITEIYELAKRSLIHFEDSGDVHMYLVKWNDTQGYIMPKHIVMNPLVRQMIQSDTKRANDFLVEQLKWLLK